MPVIFIVFLRGTMPADKLRSGGTHQAFSAELWNGLCGQHSQSGPSACRSVYSEIPQDQFLPAALIPDDPVRRGSR